ncbi:MAG: peptidoglycan DD-metalloendopeptidase family protein [Spirochaetes bacterium]|nr:peptidoglycan DD-metalloendopeptidase family protein [Spirochaetota bacterium]
MRFKIRNYHSKVSKKYYENYFLLKEKKNKIWKNILEKGHEKMTVMLIPHDEKKIFNFQISNFIILFFISLFVVVLVTSSYAVIKNRQIKNEEKRLLMSYNDIRADLVRYEKLTDEIIDIMDDLKPEIEELYQLAVGTDEKVDIWSYRDYDKETMDELLKNKRIVPSEIFAMKEIQKDILSSTSTIKTIKNFVDVRSKVINDMPSIIPNPGHISSLFGWRRSPFGHGRDFHTGIDIAAAAGTPIRATAPGVVVSAGFSGGYGIAVRIQHKFGYETIYGHMRAVAVGKGTKVNKGDRIGYVGMTGKATGNHCHYEIRLGDIPINPYPYMSRMW